jgi:hypothetical protein
MHETPPAAKAVTVRLWFWSKALLLNPVGLSFVLHRVRRQE